MIELPKTPQKPSADASKVLMLLYGAPKIGKSTFCSRFENAFFLATEPGLNHLETYNVLCKSWSDILEVVEALKADARFSTIIIDTVDNFWFYCQEYILQQYKVNFIGDLPYGKGFALVQQEFERTVKALQSLGKGLVFVSHARFDEIDLETGAKVKKTVPTLPDRARGIICSLVDVIGYAAKEEFVDSDGVIKHRRILCCSPSTLYEAGDRTGRLPEKMPFKYAIFKQHYQNTKE